MFMFTMFLPLKMSSCMGIFSLQVKTKGLTGNIVLTDGKRTQFKLDVLALYENGLRKVAQTLRHHTHAQSKMKTSQFFCRFFSESINIKTIL